MNFAIESQYHFFCHHCQAWKDLIDRRNKVMREVYCPDCENLHIISHCERDGQKESVIPKVMFLRDDDPRMAIFDTTKPVIHIVGN